MEEQKSVIYKIGYLIGHIFTIVSSIALDILYGICNAYRDWETDRKSVV